ncbi:MAG TPA: hypothetical protein PLR99_23955, partial [Polyangiaceae bacterium]|nr:hypothetical protein [Polyangiaceae bacterium]
MSRRLGRLALPTLFVAACSAASCQDPTQITVAVGTNVPYRAGVTSLAMWSSRSGAIAPGTAPQATYADAWLPDGTLGELVVTPSERRDEALTLRVVLGIGRDPAGCTDQDSKGCIVSKRTLSFVPHSRLRVPVVLWLACEGVVCKEDTTCNYVGACIPAAVDPGACASPDGCLLTGDKRLNEPSDAGPVDAADVAVAV